MCCTFEHVFEQPAKVACRDSVPISCPADVPAGRRDSYVLSGTLFEWQTQQSHTHWCYSTEPVLRLQHTGPPNFAPNETQCWLWRPLLTAGFLILEGTLRMRNKGDTHTEVSILSSQPIVACRLSSVAPSRIQCMFPMGYCGPILFLLYVSDIPHNTNFNINHHPCLHRTAPWTCRFAW